MEIFQIAERLRRDMTPAERILWDRVCKNQLGARIRRQHPIWKFIADFYCHRLKLVIEVDGSIDKRKEVSEHDRYRQRVIEEDGMKVVRFTNEQIETDIENVIVVIQELLHA